MFNKIFPIMVFSITDTMVRNSPQGGLYSVSNKEEVPEFLNFS